MPTTGSTSSGLGKNSMMAFNNICTPLFLNADPHMTGVMRISRVALRMEAIISSSVIE